MPGFKKCRGKSAIRLDINLRLWRGTLANDLEMRCCTLGSIQRGHEEREGRSRIDESQRAKPEQGQIVCLAK